MTEMLPIIRNIYVGIIGLILSSSAQSLTCDDLNGASIYSQEYTPTYLGFFGNQYASESIYYELGTYGSELSQLSVRNTFGSYGSESRQYSATNSFTTTPPTIYKNNVLLGFLTTNSTIIGGISLDLIDSSCSFTATAAANAPAPLTGLMSSSSSTSISLSWNVSQGATAYNVYQCESSSCSASELLGSVSSTVANINSLQASQTYYFAVQPSNNSSYGDVGYITAATLADSVAPVISGNVVSSINEGATALGSVTADETVTWSISGSGVSISSSGVITLDTAADYETAASYSFTITATDSNGNATSTSTLTVSVVDADENAPVITTSNVVSSINEGATALGSVTADETVTWSISGSGVSISSSGVITLDTAADYETAASYSFTITATDSNGNATSTSTLTVSVVDADENAPVITTSNVVSSINEGATALGSVTADETVTWSISGSGVSISSSGVITLDTAADYETAASYSFTITATDSNGNATSTSTLTVSVVDADENAPVITTSNVVSSINEGATALGSVTADETVTWSISGSGVSISSSGVITLDTAADYETAASYSFTITATDSNGNATSTSTLTVSVVDADENAPVITTSNVVSSINEGATALGSVTADETVTWSISGSGVSISSSGVITLDTAADYETAASYSFTITATDSNGNSVAVVIDMVVVQDSLISDSDNDGIDDASDAFPNNALYSVDSDSDGMPDAWESRYGLDPNDASDSVSDQDNDGVLALDEFLAGTIPAGSLDLDGNGQYDALTDGLLLLRGMFLLSGDSLISDAVAFDAVYKTSDEVASRIDMLGDLVDIDGNGSVDALTDGLVILRYLFNLRGDVLINDVIASDATVKTAEDVEAKIESLMPAT